ncbi:FkbM family methyltransferase [Ferruginibacter sp.]|uniref:FkbM family methyltransferase n=1 Tax=Ferruginibacter sp. TaxID=1940288 RepID=UPI002657E71C|nr:FkbM family methyltransferase [Ferruginibacter sp.]
MKTISFIINVTKSNLKRFRSGLKNPYKEINLNWFKLKYYKHLTPGKISKHMLFGKPLYFSHSLELVNGLKEIFIHNTYRQKLKEVPFIIDCGANIGLSIISMKRQYPNAEIIAYEPDDKNFHLLSENIKSFGYSNVTLHKEAVWTSNTTLQFSNAGLMSSKIETGNSNNTIEIKAIRLKYVIDREVDFLKIDIEGAEYEVLKDIADKLHLVKNMFLEYHGTFAQNGELADIINIIHSCGFNFYIKEAATLFDYPFYRIKKADINYDVQLNIFCFRV